MTQPIPVHRVTPNDNNYKGMENFVKSAVFVAIPLNRTLKPLTSKDSSTIGRVSPRHKRYLWCALVSCLDNEHVASIGLAKDDGVPGPPKFDKELVRILEQPNHAAVLKLCERPVVFIVSVNSPESL